LNTRVTGQGEKMRELLSQPPRKIVIITHVNPDGDAVGSSLALSKILKEAGHEVTVITPNMYPDFLKWMPGNDSVMVFNNNRKNAGELIKNAEILFSLDFNDLNRIKQFAALVEESQAFKIMIDHHPDPQVFSHVQYSDTGASSTAELIYDFANEFGLGGYIDRDTATCIFAGIMTDTGCFSYNSSNPYTYGVVGKLLETGINKDEIYYKIYDNFSAGRMHMLGYVLNEKMEVFPEYNTVLLSLTREEQKRFNFQPGDSEGFVNFPLSIKGVKFSVFFIEKDDHVKLSLRSKGNFSVNKFAAAHFNGGGHFNASGGEIYAPINEALEKFRNILPEYKNELKTNEE
jgi:bifunctional oligoribonuclease and PAP phosphatase NrnA